MYQKLKNPKHQKGQSKVARIPVKVETNGKPLRKPAWIRAKSPAGPKVNKIRKILREHKLNTVCEDAACPNLGECFSHGTATFLIMGDICTRRCPFCDVAHGSPEPLDIKEPQNLARMVHELKLKYVVITSVDRDDLKDGGAEHFSKCIKEIRKLDKTIKIEILTPDFRGRKEIAIEILSKEKPDVFNHNLETVPRLYAACRPGADYKYSLDLLLAYKNVNPDVLTKSGLMLGLGEHSDEVENTMLDLRKHKVDMLTLGQYLQPGKHHLPVKEYIEPAEFVRLDKLAKKMGFKSVASGAMVRSSYHADLQAAKI